MRVVFENQSTATETYPAERQTTVEHDGRSYTKVGESFANMSIGERLYAVIRLIANVCVSLFTNKWEPVKELYQEIKSGKEKVVHCIPTRSTPAGQRKFIVEMMNNMNHELVNQLAQTSTSTCFVHVKFEHGELRRQYILNPSNGAAITREFIDSKLNQIKEDVSRAIQPEWGAQHKDDWMILSKLSNGPRFHYSTGRHYVTVTNNGNGNSSYNEGTGGSSYEDTAAMHGAVDWLRDHNCTMVKIFSQNQFVPGQFYQQLA